MQAKRLTYEERSAAEAAFCGEPFTPIGRLMRRSSTAVSLTLWGRANPTLNLPFAIPEVPLRTKPDQ